MQFCLINLIVYKTFIIGGTLIREKPIPRPLQTDDLPSDPDSVDQRINRYAPTASAAACRTSSTGKNSLKYQCRVL